MPAFGHSTMDARNGMFEIECDNNMRGQEEMLVGMAKVGAHGIVAPVAVVSLAQAPNPVGQVTFTNEARIIDAG